MNHKQYEVFRTPQWVINDLINSEHFSKIVIENNYQDENDNNLLQKILDPSAGDNRIIDTICNNKRFKNFFGTDTNIHIANDILPNEKLNYNKDYDILHEEFKANNTKFDLIISNPPFSKAFEWVQKMHEVMNDNSYCVFLQRLNWAGTIERSRFFKYNKDIRLKYVLIIPKRPTWEIDGVKKNKTDTCEYAWFIFQKGFDGESVIDWLI